MKQPKRRRRAAPARATKRKRRGGALRTLLIVAAVAGGLLGAGFLDRETGVGHWLDLRRDAAEAKQRIGAIEARIASHERQAEALADDDVAIEAAIREDLGLARPGEWVMREEGSTSLRNP